MADTHDFYVNPLSTRYASKEMSALLSENNRITWFRKLWIALAETEMELGLPITAEQIDEMKKNISPIDFETAAKREREVRHDVMAHIYTFGLACPKAAPIIHLGATSCFVTDNADMIIYRDALNILKDKLADVLFALKNFALKYKSLPTLGYTHLQPAQLVTVGKRATLWAQDFVLDYHDLETLIDGLKLRGVKGTTGTQASFLELFNGDHSKVKALEKGVIKKMGFKAALGVSGQTYTRKLDYSILCVLSKIAQSAYKMSGDIRILQSNKEIEEPFEKSQIGSSAMAYKRNPMRSERIASLSRLAITLPENAAITAGTQWMERTLDDSANRRIVMAEALLTVDAVLELCINVLNGLVVNEKVIAKRVKEELPFMATENILMESVKLGGNRQELHEHIRQHSMAAGAEVKKFGRKNDLIARIKADPAFAPVLPKLNSLLNPKSFIGRAPQQVVEFVREEINPILKEHINLGSRESAVKV